MLVLTIVITVDAVAAMGSDSVWAVPERPTMPNRLRFHSDGASRVDEPDHLNRLAAFKRASLGVELGLTLD
jgi:hypothetical protein